MSAATDLVYIVGGETPDDRADLRHSLRSLINCASAFRDVWVVGDVPAWFRGRALPLAPRTEKFTNQRASLTAYVNHPDAAEQMVVLNDDMFIAEPTATLPVCRNKNRLSGWVQAERAERSLNTWHRAVIATAEWVAEHTGTDPYIYECHTPLTFDTAKLRDLLADYPPDRPFAVGELYPLAGTGGEGVHCGNAKVKAADSLETKLANPMPYLSGNPDSWRGALGDLIRDMFPNPSRWEKPMLNAEMIKDQKQSPGLIENPLRDVLIDLASKVPADEAIVELGSYMGRSTAHLALGSSLGNEAPVHAFDPWDFAEEPDPEYLASAPSVASYREPSTREAFEDHMTATGAGEYVTAHICTGVEGAAAYDGPKVGLLFHDALHMEDDVFADLKAWLPHMAKDAVIVLHDTDDIRYGVEAGAEKALTCTKALREKWNWEGRENHPWAKNAGRAPEDRRRGFMVIRTR